MIFGDTKQLHFELNWSPEGRALATGGLRVRIGDTNVWADDVGNGVTWTWIELLEHLAGSWPFLCHEQRVPEEVGDELSYLLRTGNLRDSEFGAEGISRELYLFIRRHNLATGIEGLFLPSLSILKEGRKVWVASRNRLEQFEFSVVVETLKSLGDVIAQRISAESSERTVRAITQWQGKELPFSSTILIDIGTHSAKNLVPQQKTAEEFFEVTADRPESSLLAFARMSGFVPIDVQRTVIEWLRQRERRTASRLDQLSLNAEKSFPRINIKAYAQGYEIARWARRELNLPPEIRIDPGSILSSLNVEWESRTLGVDSIDAIGCWDLLHGPAILVNRDGQHSTSLQGRRATLAHELAHLLVDRRGSLPVAEVLGAGAPTFPEKRARAFAAEFLLPHSAIARTISQSIDRISALEQMRKDYDVSRELAGWHIKNSNAFRDLSISEQTTVIGWTRSEYEREPDGLL